MTDDAPGHTPLHDDLVEMLTATCAAERDVFGMLEPAVRDAPRLIGEWSAKDVLAHLAAWRAIEAHRLETGWDRQSGEDAAGSSGLAESEDEANARIQAQRADWPWEQVVSEAEASIDALVASIRGTPAETLRKSERLVAGIGSNGANHAIGHLADVAPLANGDARFRAFADEIEAILLRGRLPDRDAGVMLYNIACFNALAGQLAEARRLLVDAFGRRQDLLEWALQDPDVAALRDELPGLAASAAPEGREAR